MTTTASAAPNAAPEVFVATSTQVANRSGRSTSCESSAVPESAAGMSTPTTSGVSRG